MRAYFLAALLATGCAGVPAHSKKQAPDAALIEIADARAEVAAMGAAARDAAAALAPEEQAWEQARQRLVTPFDRAFVERRLAEHAERHGLELSQFRLGLPQVEEVELPALVHPQAPFPISAAQTVIEAPIRFALTPLRPDRIEAFVRTLPEVTPLVVVRALERGMDFVEVHAGAPTLRPLDPEPRYAVEAPQVEAILARTGGEGSAAFTAAHAELVAEVEEANLQLEALSAARLRHERLRGWRQAEARAAENAAKLALPPPARAGEKATRSTAP